MSETPAEKTIRIGKLLAHAGIISRREAADFLANHDVRIDGERVVDLNHKIPESELLTIKLTVDRRHIALSGSNEVILLHKPTGVACSHRRQRIRGKDLKTIFDLLPEKYARWFFAGRLDVSSSGLVLLSNDGDHIFALSHPSHGVLKKYLVRTSRPLSNAERARMEKGIMDKGEKLRFEKIIPLEVPAQYEIHLREGKNREIRRLLERVGVFARQLVRTELGPYKLEGIEAGKFSVQVKVAPEFLSGLRGRSQNTNSG